MKAVQVYIVAALVAAAVSVPEPRHHSEGYKICVPDKYLALCQQMVYSPEARHDVVDQISCTSAPDKISCIDRIIKGDAHWVIIDPEELYVAHRFLPQNGVVVSSEIRSKEFENRDYRYAPVVVVRKTANINSIADLAGKRSCHTHYGRNSGWNVPFSHLFLKRQLNCSAEGTSAIERDLATVSNYFGPACIPGQWSPDVVQDANLKKKYSNLCALCKNPETCATEDEYAGYPGALKCLTQNNGDVSFTKFDTVVDYFQLKGTPMANVEEYQLLCQDGSVRPLTSEQPCSWAHRPWPTVVVSAHYKPSQVKELQNLITKLAEKAQQTTPTPQWYTKTLGDHHVIHHYNPYKVKTLTPQVYLQKTNYTQTFWHPSCGVHEKAIRFCVYNQVELEKCQTLKLAAIGQRISPGFSCVLGTCAGHCSWLVSKGEADLIVTSPQFAHELEYKRNYTTKLTPILRELEATNKPGVTVPVRYALAVIQENVGKEFTTGNLSPLKNKRSCHGSTKSLTGVNIPLSVLRDAGEITGENCQLPSAAGNYFAQSCVPGALKGSKVFADLPTDKLCAICAGDGEGPGKAMTPETVCANDQNERYYGGAGALLCLKDKVADVAFVDHVALLEMINSQTTKEALPYQLLCKNGTVTELQNFRECHWGMVPTNKILARSGDENKVGRENAILSLLRAYQTFMPGAEKSKVFKLFGKYYGTSNVIFQDSAVGLGKELPLEEVERENKIIADFNYCKVKEVGSPHGRSVEYDWAPKEQI